jgi:hypothetical protein
MRFRRRRGAAGAAFGMPAGVPSRPMFGYGSPIHPGASMSITRIVVVIVAFTLFGLAIQRMRDPLRTALPFGTTDLSSVQSALERLNPSDRKLVEAYVKRSNGDVLMPSMADPDEPFTARTFEEAIALEKDWDVKRGEQEAVAASRQAERDDAMSPLREAVEANVTRTEILSPRDLSAPPDPDAPVKSALPSDDATIFVATVSLHNLGSKTIVGVKGSLEAREPDAFLPLNLCWVDVDERQPIEPASRIEIRCANVNHHVSDEQRAFMDDAGGRFTLEWNPQSVVFADGSRLDSGL